MQMPDFKLTNINKVDLELYDTASDADPVRPPEHRHAPFLVLSTGPRLSSFASRESATMTPAERMHDRLAAIAETHPAEEERLAACARVVLEHDNRMLNRYVEAQLDRILATSEPDAARKITDRLEYELMNSPVLSPFLGARESRGFQRRAIVAAISAVTVAAFIATLLVAA